MLLFLNEVKNRFSFFKKKKFQKLEKKQHKNKYNKRKNK